ncbi:MAG: penicillin-binding protein 2 [Chloroflexota bacterium]
MVDVPAKRSFRALYIAILVMFVLLVGQLYNMQIIQGAKFQDSARDNRQRTITTKANRGIIYDRTGQRLVVNNPSFSVAVTPADLPDVNCATGSIEGASVFNILSDTLKTNDVIVLKPKDLPADRIVEVANRLSVPLQVNKNILVEAIQAVKSSTPDSGNLFVIRRDVPVAIGAVLSKETEHMPGIKILNELEYNFITRLDACYKPITVKRGVQYDVAVELETKLAHLPGVEVVPEPVRVYTQGSYFSHLLGYVGPISQDEYEQSKNVQGDKVYDPDDKVGQTGLEAALESDLRGVKGAAQVVVNSQMQVVSEIASQAPITGNNVKLTIDSALQISTTQALQKGLQLANVQAGVAIVVRVDNGQVLSMVSLPSYDNNLFSSGITQSNFDKLNTDPTLPMFDRAVGGAYPPGSTYKMITASAALQEGIVTPDTTYYCPGYIQVPNTRQESLRTSFRDWRVQGHGDINIVQALTVSSDVFFYIMAGPHQEDRVEHLDDGTDKITYTRYYTPGAKQPIEFNGLGIERLKKYADAFGLGKRTGIELPGEVAGIAPDQAWKLERTPDNPWSLGDTLFTAIGQGDNLVTPLQLVNVTAAVANGGTLYQPQLVLTVADTAGNVVRDYQPKTLGQVPVSPQNLAVVREGMRQVIADKVKGTAASRFTLKSIEVAGKTGTAEYGEPIGKKNGKDVRRSHAWFTAFAPYDKPEVAVVVLLEGGQESLEGSTYAVPVADEILKAYFHVDK